MISELMLLKLATRVLSRLSYSLGSITRVSVVWMLPKKGGQHRAHQQHIEHIVLGLLKDPAVNNGGGDPHEHQIHCKGQIGVGGHHTGGAQEKPPPCG